MAINIMLLKSFTLFTVVSTSSTMYGCPQPANGSAEECPTRTPVNYSIENATTQPSLSDTALTLYHEVSQGRVLYFN